MSASDSSGRGDCGKAAREAFDSTPTRKAAEGAPITSGHGDLPGSADVTFPSDRPGLSPRETWLEAEYAAEVQHRQVLNQQLAAAVARALQAEEERDQARHMQAEAEGALSGIIHETSTVLDFDQGRVLTGEDAAGFTTEGTIATTEGVGGGPSVAKKEPES